VTAHLLKAMNALQVRMAAHVATRYVYLPCNIIGLHTVTVPTSADLIVEHTCIPHS